MSQEEHPKILEYINENNEIVETNSIGGVDHNFGSTVPGKINIGRYSIKNTLPEMITLKPWSTDSDLHVSVNPNQVDAGGKAELVLEFSPPKTRYKSLKGDNWGVDVEVG